MRARAVPHRATAPQVFSRQVVGAPVRQQQTVPPITTSPIPMMYPTARCRSRTEVDRNSQISPQSTQVASPTSIKDELISEPDEELINRTQGEETLDGDYAEETDVVATDEDTTNHPASTTSSGATTTGRVDSDVEDETSNKDYDSEKDISETTTDDPEVEPGGDDVGENREDESTSEDNERNISKGRDEDDVTTGDDTDSEDSNNADNDEDGSSDDDDNPGQLGNDVGDPHTGDKDVSDDNQTPPGSPIAKELPELRRSARERRPPKKFGIETVENQDDDSDAGGSCIPCKSWVQVLTDNLRHGEEQGALPVRSSDEEDH